MQSSIVIGKELRDTNDELSVSSHYVNAMKNINKMYLNKNLCDVTLICNQKHITAHRLVLCSVSDYFYAMFNGSLCEAKKTDIVIKDVDEDALSVLVDFIYTGKIEVDETNVCSILSAANMLQIKYVVNYACEYLLKCLNSTNSIGIYRFSDKYSLSHLKTVSKEYILDNYECIVNQSQEFNELTIDELKIFLSNDSLNIKSEEFAFESLMKWLRYDTNARLTVVHQVLELIRLPLMDPIYFTRQIETNKLLLSSSKCQALLLDAATYHITPEKFFTLPTSRTLGRKSTAGFLLAVGGVIAAECNKGQVIEKYDSRTDSWTLITHMNTKRLQCGASLVDKQLYTVGGREGLKTLNTVDYFDLDKDKWLSSNSMSTHRHGVGVVFYNGCIYAVGGHDGWSFLNTVERYDLETGVWTYVTPMHNQRSTHGCTVMNNRLYSVGGRDSIACLSTVECYNSNSNKWIACSSMFKKRGSVGVAALNGFLYAVGGYELPNTLMSCIRYDCAERYDSKTDQWTIIASLYRAKEAVGVQTLGQHLYAVGGFDGNRYLNEVEKYDPNKNEWTRVHSLNVPRAGACVVYARNYNRDQNDDKLHKKRPSDESTNSSSSLSSLVQETVQNQSYPDLAIVKIIDDNLNITL